MLLASIPILLSLSAEPNLRIIGGEPSSECGWPNVVAVRTLGGTCTGTLVKDDLVLTAAHCEDPVRVFFGQSDDQGHHPASSLVGECWSLDQSGGRDDAQLCRLFFPQPHIPIIPIISGPEADQLQVHGEVTLVGYGRTQSGPKDEPQVPANKTKFHGRNVISGLVEDVIIVGPSPRETSCFGDSGGPLFYELDDGSLRQVGIASWGSNGCLGQSGYVDLRRSAELLEEISGEDITALHDGQTCTFGETLIPTDMGELEGTWGECTDPEEVTIRCGGGVVPVTPPDEEDQLPVGCRQTQEQMPWFGPVILFLAALGWRRRNSYCPAD